MSQDLIVTHWSSWDLHPSLLSPEPVSCALAHTASPHTDHPWADRKSEHQITRKGRAYQLRKRSSLSLGMEISHGLPDWRRLPGGVRALGAWRDRVLRVCWRKCQNCDFRIIWWAEVRFKSEWQHVLQMLFSSSRALAEPQEALRFCS